MTSIISVPMTSDMAYEGGVHVEFQGRRSVLLRQWPLAMGHARVWTVGIAHSDGSVGLEMTFCHLHWLHFGLPEDWLKGQPTGHHRNKLEGSRMIAGSLRTSSLLCFSVLARLGIEEDPRKNGHWVVSPGPSLGGLL